MNTFYPSHATQTLPISQGGILLDLWNSLLYMYVRTSVSRILEY